MNTLKYSLFISILISYLVGEANPFNGGLGLILGANGACYPLSSTWTPQWANIVGYWKLDESSGATTIVDSSTSGTNTGTPSSVNLGDPGRINKAASFNGTSSTISFSDNTSLDLTNELTITLWIKPEATQGIYTDILSKHGTGGVPNGYTIEQYGTNTNQFIFGWGDGVSWNCPSTVLATVTSGIWQHLAFVKSGTTVYAYINGILKNSCTGTSSTIATNTGNLYLSRWSDVASRFFNGHLDDVAIWSTALTSLQIKTIYNQQSCGLN